LSEASFRRTLDFERERALRNDHEYSLVLLDLSSFIDNEEKVNHLIESIAQRIRVVDEFGWHDRKRIGVILPYTPKKGADSFATYICQAIDFQIQRLGCEVYTYGRKNNMDDKPLTYKAKERA
jgi:hypothetical protein